MNIGFIGLGKLGLPVALAIEDRGHNVVGYDINPDIKKILSKKKLPYKEKGADQLLEKTKIKFLQMSEVVDQSDIIFVTIQTPHSKKFSGVTKIPKERKDFNYEFLKDGLIDLSKIVEEKKTQKTVVIISTVLPGTIRNYIKPILSNRIKLCYNPFFIAMGTTIDDFLNSEIILFGVDNEGGGGEAAKKAEEFYKTINNTRFFKTTIENAELIKVVYNTFISTKIAMINSVMETCHSLPNTNIDDISDALSLCNQRIISNKYMYGGMGDGGGCHPRDNIAMSWLAKKLNLSFNFYESIMEQRERQTYWLAKIIIENKFEKHQKIIILGKSFKPETNLILGSPSILLKNILEEMGENVLMWDPYIDSDNFLIQNEITIKPNIFFIGTKHESFKNFNFFKGSTIIDPFRYLNLSNKFKYIPIGKNI
jgi:UDPglucose 6-dehydrogenase